MYLCVTTLCALSLLSYMLIYAPNNFEFETKRDAVHAEAWLEGKSSSLSNKRPKFEIKGEESLPH